MTTWPRWDSSTCPGGKAFAAAKKPSPATPPDAPVKASPLLATMKTELDRSFATLSAQDPKAYFIGYAITDTQRAEVSGSNGALLSSSEDRNRWLEVSVRTGDYNLDNTHKIGERQSQTGGPGMAVPIDNDAEVLRRSLWLETDKQYRAGAGRVIKNCARKRGEAGKTQRGPPDFTHQQP